MAKRYPILVRKKKAKSPGAYGECQHLDCKGKGIRATHRLEVQETYMRGDDEFYRFCDQHTESCEKGCHKW